MTLWHDYGILKFEVDAILYGEIQCRKMDKENYPYGQTYSWSNIDICIVDIPIQRRIWCEKFGCREDFNGFCQTEFYF